MQMPGAGFHQNLLEQQSVKTVGIIVRNGADHVVAMPFIEMEGADVVYGSFQADCGAVLSLEPGFGCT